VDSARGGMQHCHAVACISELTSGFCDILGFRVCLHSGRLVCFCRFLDSPLCVGGGGGGRRNKGGLRCAEVGNTTVKCHFCHDDTTEGLLRKSYTCGILRQLSNAPG